MKTEDLNHKYETLINIMSFVSKDCADDIKRICQDGLENPMSAEDARVLFNHCIEQASRSARSRGDAPTSDYLEAQKDRIVTQAMNAREEYASKANAELATSPIEANLLEGYEGTDPHEVRPAPVFHNRRINVTEGFVDVSKIHLWEENQRLEIHVEQFRKAHGRNPDSDDLIKIMCSKANLAGLDSSDQFKIIDLARSIAAGGVRNPPIIAADGTLLDGNRRVAACLLVRNSDEYPTEAKTRASKIRVWQLTPQATSEDKHAVVVSLNFEPDNKVEWPEYVKGRKVYEEWRSRLEVEERPSDSRIKALKQDLARHFALTVQRVNRYIQMIELSDEFEEHARNKRNKDRHEVQHRANDSFQYFDELGKGRNSGGVNWALNQDENFKHLVFDLLYDRKFRNWKAIRDLKYVYNNEEAIEHLQKARHIDDESEAQYKVDDGLAVGRTARVQERVLAGNTRVETFVKWLREAPVEFFSVGDPGAITAANLRNLYEAFKLVEGYFRGGLSENRAEEPDHTA